VSRAVASIRFGLTREELAKANLCQLGTNSRVDGGIESSSVSNGFSAPPLGTCERIVPINRLLTQVFLVEGVVALNLIHELVEGLVLSLEPSRRLKWSAGANLRQFDLK
jgi:hypothetical protein